MSDKQSILELLDDAAEKCRVEGATPHSRRFRLPNDYIANLCEAAAKRIRCADDSIDYLENSVSAHEENNVKICRENRALMRYFNSVENVLESDSHNDWSEYQAAKAAVLGSAMVLLRPAQEKCEGCGQIWAFGHQCDL